MKSDRLSVVEPEPNLALIQRRSLFGVAGLSLTSLLLPPLTARADDDNITLTPLNDGIFYLPTSPSEVISVPATLGVALTTKKLKKAGMEIQVTFDPRLYELLTLPVLSDETGADVPCEWAVQKDGTGIVKFTEAMIPDKTYTLVMGKRILFRFPVDIVEQPSGTQYQVRGKASQKTSGRAGVKSKTPVWGACVGASWELIRWGAGFHSWWPNLITVTALGPGKTPENMFVTVELDSRLISSAQLTPRNSGGKVKSVTRNGLTTLVWALQAPLVAGTYATAILEASLKDRKTELAELAKPTVSVHCKKASIGQRITGGESLQRDDSAYDKTTVATFGLESSER